MDEAPEAAPKSDGSANALEARMSPVEIRHEAGNRLDSTYTDSNELMCSVCSEPHPDIMCPERNQTSPTALCTNGLMFGSECTFSCPATFFVDGPPAMRCMQSGQWSVHKDAVSCVPSVVRATDVYVRWGASHCGEHASLVYMGRTVGAKDADRGSGANHLCMRVDREKKFPRCKRHSGAIGSGGSRYMVGSTFSFEECEDMVRTNTGTTPSTVDTHRASGVSWNSADWKCYAEHGVTTLTANWQYQACMFEVPQGGGQLWIKPRMLNATGCPARRAARRRRRR